MQLYELKTDQIYLSNTT